MTMLDILYISRHSIIIIIIIIILIWIFFTPALADDFFTEIWVLTSLLKSPGFFSVFRPISAML